MFVFILLGLLFLIVLIRFFSSNCNTSRSYWDREPIKRRLDEEDSPETKLIIAQATARLDRKDSFRKQHHYRSTHTPWDQLGRRCVTCGLSLLDIDLDGLHCSGKYGKRGLTLTQAFMLEEEKRYKVLDSID